MSNIVLVDVRVLDTVEGAEYVKDHFEGNPTVKLVFVSFEHESEGDGWLPDESSLIRPSKRINVSDFDACYTYLESVFRSFANGFEPVAVFTCSLISGLEETPSNRAFQEATLSHRVPIRLLNVETFAGTSLIGTF